jgi:hypothetical protein
MLYFKIHVCVCVTQKTDSHIFYIRSSPIKFTPGRWCASVSHTTTALAGISRSPPGHHITQPICLHSQGKEGVSVKPQGQQAFKTNRNTSEGGRFCTAAVVCSLFFLETAVRWVLCFAFDVARRA